MTESKLILIKAHKIALKYGCADDPNWKPKENLDECVNENN